MNYKYLLFLFLSVLSFNGLKAQKLEEIYFHLYTDSLKRGTFNYINVDGKFSNGNWRPLTDKELIFKSDVGYFKGNSLFLADTLQIEKVKVWAILKSDTTIQKSTDIYIKISSDWGKVVSSEEVIQDSGNQRKKRRN